jgi:transcriptional regulator with XRE-family HTH domain
MKIAELLTAWRHHGHMSIREAAERIGLTSSTLARLEQGKAVSSETLAVIWRWMLES